MVNLLGDAELEAIAARADAATKVPWTAYHRCSGCTGEDDECCGIGPEITGPPNRVNKGQFERGVDASFIAAARQDVPALLAQVRYLKRRLDAAEELTREMDEALESEAHREEEPECACHICANYRAWREIVEEGLPTAQEITGSDPDFTGSLTTKEHIAKIRGQDHFDGAEEEEQGIEIVE